MALDLTFNDVCSFVKKDGKPERKLLDAVDNLLGFALICSPIALGPASVPFLGLLGVKGELVRIGRAVLDGIAKRKSADYVGRQERMEAAYALICFTAGFEALDRSIPAQLRKSVELIRAQRLSVAESAAEKAAPQSARLLDLLDDGSAAAISSTSVAFPHPTETLDEQKARHRDLWKQIGQGFQELLQQLELTAQLSAEHQQVLANVIRELPEKAEKHFEQQYFELARQFPDFAVWANLHEHKGTKELIADLSGRLSAYLDISSAKQAIDVGFARLGEAVEKLPELFKIERAEQLIAGLARHYDARINEPLIDDREQGDTPHAKFPKVKDAFIPQAFLVTRQLDRVRQLEEPSRWSDLPRRDDLGAFLMSYLSSPYSTETPLLILGHPGSGKSLLTTVLASRLMSKPFSVIRVPLREVNADSGIVGQIEDAIRKVTNVGQDNWVKISAAFKNAPPVVILDGYDELLQASGKVFAGYLKDVERFQANQAAVQKQPVRVIVTSRITLIDKANVPVGTTVVRLLEFDDKQRRKWISIWNGANAQYFRKADVKPFALPSDDDEGSSKIISLAEQPLLLLMLALYDSLGNQLHRDGSIDRTRLYDSLLRRFVEREKEKDPVFRDELGDEAKREIVDHEMKRLGAVAIGMYNRRQVHILSTELDEDLQFFDLKRRIGVSDGPRLSQGELLLGSFFFVHKSQAGASGAGGDSGGERSAFEFLHNTFGEFLTADFIIRRAVAEAATVKALSASDALRDQLSAKLGTPNGLHREWFATLVYTPLFSRPVVLEMMGEWIRHVLSQEGLEADEFGRHLDEIVLSQIKRILDTRDMPSILQQETVEEHFRVPFGKHPLLGHIAVYSVNLILLRLMLIGDTFTFDEQRVSRFEDGARPWDRLTHLWRAWFSLENLHGLTAIMRSARSGESIAITAGDEFRVSETRSRLEALMHLGLCLGDDILSALAALVLDVPGDRDWHLPLETVEGLLVSERIDLGAEMLVRRLREAEYSSSQVEHYFDLFRGAARSCLYDAPQHLLTVAESLRRYVRQVSGRISVDRTESRFIARQMYDALEPRFMTEMVARNPEAAIPLVEAAVEAGNERWLAAFARETIEASLYLGRYADSDGLTMWQVLSHIFGELKRHRGRNFREDFLPYLDHLARSGMIVDLARRDPLGALTCLDLITELGLLPDRSLQGRVLYELCREIDISDMLLASPEQAVALLELLANSVHDPAADFPLGLLQDQLDRAAWADRALHKLVLDRPALATRLFRLFAEEGPSAGARLMQEFMMAMPGRDFTDAGALLDLARSDPSTAESWLTFLVNALSDAERRDLVLCFVKPLLLHPANPTLVLELAETSVDLANAYLSLAEAHFGDGEWETLDWDDRSSALESRMASLVAADPRALETILKLVRLDVGDPKSRRTGKIAVAALGSLNRKSLQRALERLPVSSIDDARYFEASATAGLRDLFHSVLPLQSA